MTPENNYKYADALEHMKKDKGQNRLDELIKEYKKQIKIFNEAITRNGDLIIQQISSVCGVEPKIEKTKLGQIFIFLNTELSKVKGDQDIHDWAKSDNRGYNITDGYREVQECVNKLIKDEIILGSFDEVREKYKRLHEIVTKLQQKASSISQAINDEDYDINAKCCPSYITIIKDLINYD